VLASERKGSGEPLVLLHGIAHHRQAWYPVVDKLAADREVFLVDLPGFGESGKLITGGKPPRQAMIDQLVEFLDEQGLDRPHIAGNSLGGQYALELAALGRASSVTALSPGAFWSSYLDYMYTVGLFGTVMAGATLLSPFARRLCSWPIGRSAMFFWVCARPRQLSPERALSDFKNLMRTRTTMFRFITGGARFKNTIPDDVRLTVCWAHWDMVLPRYQARRARRLLPQAEHIRLDHCGHVPMSDDPDLIAELILRGSAP